MSKGFDTSTPLTAEKAKEFADKGYTFVCRYLAPQDWRSWKALTVDEAQAITDAGIMIVSVWETSAGAAGEGTEAGREAGIFALQSAKEVGQPEGTKIYFCIDFQPQPDQFEAIADYFIAVKREIGNEYIVDAYGNDSIINYLKYRGIISNGVIPNGWQTIAWSYGRVADGISIYQHDCGETGLGFTECGISIDADESYGNEGWWNLNMKFTDTKGHWAEKCIEVVSESGIMTGYDDGTFKPDQQVTRAELAKVVNDLVYMIKG